MRKKKNKPGLRKGLDTVGMRLLVITMAILMTFQFSTASLSGIAIADTDLDEAEVLETEQAEAAEEVTAPEETPEVTAEPPEETGEEPAAEPAEEPVEEPADAPAEEPTAEPAEEPAAEPADAPAEEPAAEPAETPVETAPAETVTYPAVSFDETAGSTEVFIDAPEGALPEGTTVKTEEVAVETVQEAVEEEMGSDVTVVKAIDITFFDKDGNEIEPLVPISVKFQSYELRNVEEPAVVHVDNEGEATQVEEGLVEAEGSAVEFQADEFSIYAIVETGNTGDFARAEVVFKSGSNERATVYVKNSDTADELKGIIYDPGVGDIGAGKTFRGWYVSKSETPDYTKETVPMNIQGVRDYFESLAITEGDVYYVHAVIFSAYNVSYVSDTGTVIDNVTLLAVDGTAETYEIDREFEPENPDTQQFQGWYVSGAATHEDGSAIGATETLSIGDKIKVTGDVEIKAKAPKGQYLIFKENGTGASYTAAQFLETGDVTVEPKDPVRPGYTFDGWYTGEPSAPGEDPTGTLFEFGSTISARTYLYAKWSPNETAGYTVIIWKQNVGDAKDAADANKTYDFATSVSLSGRVGTTINTVSATGTGNSRHAVVNGTSYQYEGFHLNKYDTNVTIDTLGNSVVNVYYDRNLVTFTFVHRSNGQWVTDQTMTGLYGQTLTSQGYTWPTNRWWYDSYGQSWGEYYGDGTRTTFLDAFILSDGGSEQTFYGFNGNGSGHVYFYKQNADGSYPSTATNTVNTSGGTFYISDKYNGYKAVQYSRNGSTWTDLGDKDSSGYYAAVSNISNLYIRYAPKTYNILYKDGVYVDGNGAPVEGYDPRGQLKVVENIPIDSSLTSYNKGGANYYAPEFNGFVFEGWYIDDACTQPFTFTSMPEGITVYAKWRQIEYRVFLNPGVPQSDTSFDMGDQQTSFRASYGENLNISKATRDDFELMGWYYKDESGKYKTFSEEAYAMNEQTPGLAEYDKTRSTETGKYGEVIENINKDANNNRFWITQSLDLYAQWRGTIDGAKGINVVYDATEDGTDAPTDSLYYKDKTNAKAQGASTPKDSNEQFLYWVVQKWDGSAFVDTDVTVFPGDTFEVLKSNAKVEDYTDPDDPDVTKKYTVQLRAAYGPKSVPTPTHISWYKNDGTEAFETDNNLAINSPVSIEQPVTRSGYVFKGWARIPTGTDPETSEAWEANEDNWTQENASEYMYLYYGEDGKFHLDSPNGKAVTDVAADEKTPYHAMFAVWAAEVTAVVTGSEDTQKYNGSEQTNDEYTVTYYVGGEEVESLPTGVTFTLTSDPAGAAAKGTDVGTYTTQLGGTLTSTNDNYVIPENAVTTDEEYKGKITLEITKRTVTLTSATESKVYDGTALTNDEITVGGDGFVSGEGATYNVTGTQTEVGSSANAFTYTLNNNTKAGNYEITKTEGTLTVTALTDKVTVTIKENSGSEKYDGTEKTVTGYTVESISNPLYTEADFSFKGDATVKGTDAGTYNMELKPADFTNTNTNFTNVEFVIEDGTLVISKRTVTLTSADDEKVYDGTALTNDEVTVGGDGFATGEGATYDVTGSQTNAGESDNTFTYTLNEGTKADNYTITKVEGTLKVTPVTDKVTVTITENSGSAKYDGEAHTIDGYKSKVADNELYDVATSVQETKTDAWTVTKTDAGTYDMGIVADDFANINNNFSNVEFKVVDGQLEITKRTVTLTSATDTKVYDGTALTNDEVTVGGDGFVEGEGATYDVTGTQTNAGSSANAFTYTLNEGTKADNYEITKTEGTLTVTASTDEVVVVIKENSDSEKYDGTEKTVTAYTVTSISSPLYAESDFTFSGNATVKGTDAGTYNMELKPADFTNTNTNFTNVTFQIVDGTLVISKRAVTLTSASDEKVYDGTALTNDEVTVGGDGFATGEGATYNVTGSQTDAGESANAFTYTLNEGTKAANYDITTTNGTLKVTPVTDKVTVTITENSGSEKYDGTEKTVTGYTVKSISNPLYKEADFSFKGDATVKGTDAGTYNMELKPADFSNTSKNFTNVEFVIEDGTLVISKRAVTLTSADDEKVYDGTALTNSTVTVTEDGWAEGEGATYDVTGTQTDAGESDNTFTYKLNNGTKADNYEITTVAGTLKVTPVTDKVTVTITGNKESKDYNGSEQKAEGYTVSIDNELYKESDIAFEGKAEATGTNAGTYPMNLKEAQFSNTSKNFTNVEFVVIDGELEINKLEIVLTSATDEKEYDGTPLTNDEVTMEGKLAPTDEITYNVTGSQTYVGSSKNTFTYEIKTKEGGALSKAVDAIKNSITAFAADEEGNFPMDNYVVKVNYGTLTVTEPDDPDKVVTKTHEDKAYKAGETITFTITVTNIYDEVKDITIEEQKGVTITGESEFKDVKAGGVVTTTATYTVTEEDVKAGTFTNKVKATFSDVDDPWENEDKVDEFAHMTVTKKVTNTPEDGQVFRTGETIKYEITVTNDGTADMKDVVVKDELTGDEWTVAKLAKGDSKSFKAEYKVTEADAKNGSVTNVATAEGTDKDGDKIPGTPGEVTTKTDKTPDAPPKTGDTTIVTPYIVIGASSLILLLMLLFRRRKENAK